MILHVTKRLSVLGPAWITSSDLLPLKLNIVALSNNGVDPLRIFEGGEGRNP